MYEISKYSGKIKNVSTNEIFDYDDRLTQFNDFLIWEQTNELIFVDYLDGELEEYIKNENLKKETELYIKRSEDGKNAYAAISAEFRLAKLSDQISEETHAAIEKSLIPVRNEVLAGQWISAKNELIYLGIITIGQDLYDRLYLQITNYIAENY